MISDIENVDDSDDGDEVDAALDDEDATNAECGQYDDDDEEEVPVNKKKRAKNDDDDDEIYYDVDEEDEDEDDDDDPVRVFRFRKSSKPKEQPTFFGSPLELEPDDDD